MTVSGATRTFTYLLPTGSTLVLSEPAGGQLPGATDYLAQPDLAIGGCGWFNVCLYLNWTDQRALVQGSLAALAAIACLAGGPIICVGAAFALGGALVYIGDHGFCSNQLQIGLLPPGSNLNCV